jgi:hypothetical protein
MSQAPRSLSKSQILTLETCYLFLRTLRPILLSVGNEVNATSRETLDEVNRLRELNLERLIETFPEVADADRRWNVAPGSAS